MFFRTVSVTVLVALSIANTTVRGSEVTALQDAFKNITQTWDTFQVNYEAFSAHVDINHATAVTDAMRTLDLQVQDALKAIPDHVMSDTDGKWACDMYSDGDANRQVWKNMIPLKDDFHAVNFTYAVCQILLNLVANSTPFDRKFLAAVPAKYKPCIGRFSHTVGKELGKVAETYCSEE
ncbi:hypothetical protein ARMGADRAFT_1081362 [Armillaria gallica]|uniref:Uncharacterized protein n=1 Tax=Armillaria gallica TaxID=47427 RepID=A0A2H3D9M1_ARMGA|nr:hypothetical protein ARMGADRAFT_1081362 [Armillaria gallica]